MWNSSVAAGIATCALHAKRHRLSRVRLSEFLITPDWTQDRLASEARTTQGTISHLCAGTRKASLALALRIERATGGQVRAEDVPMTRRARVDLRELRASALRDRGEGAAA